MTKVSVIIPVYNTEKYLRECLDSVVNQTLDGIEIIIVDDGSTDKSPEIIEKYRQKYLNIVVITQKNSGQSIARNRGLKVARGEYIGFVDSDDVIDLKMYEILYKEAVEGNFKIAQCMEKCGRKPEFSSGIKYRKYSCDCKDSLKAFFEKRDGSLCKGIFKKELFKNLFFKEKRIAEDLLLKPFLIYKAKKILYINKKMYFYRQTEESTMRGIFSSKEWDVIYVTRFLKEYFYKIDKKNYNYYKKEAVNMDISWVYEIFNKALKYNYFLNVNNKIPKYISKIYVLKVLLLGIILYPDIYFIQFWNIVFEILFQKSKVYLGC